MQTRYTILMSAIFAGALLFPAGIRAEDPLRIENGVSDGIVWARFDVRAEFEAGRYAHAGWDFFNESKKLFYVGSGWQQRDRMKWGLWDSSQNKYHFSRPIQSGKNLVIVLRIDFGAKQAGDESVHLWIEQQLDLTESTFDPESAMAVVSGMTIPAIDGVKLFRGRGYKFSDVSFSRSSPLPPRIDSRNRKSNTTSSKSHPETDVAAELFLTQIQPLFVEKCGACHGETAREIKGGFDMRNRVTLMKGGESSEPAIDVRHPDDSVLLTAIRWTDGLEMPPKENDRLRPEQIKMIRRWIAAGAPWPEKAAASVVTGEWSEPDAKGAVRVRTSGGQSEAWTNRRYAPDGLWAYRPLSTTSVPAINRTYAQTPHPIDAFIRSRLADAELRPAPRSDSRTLARRVSFGLTGLPTDLQADTTDYEELIDRLLESPHYGERMAQHWLDVVRYADSNGYSRDDFRDEAHRYRTYVIESFNGDKPYNRFIREQIAGDELDLAGQEALAFLWMGPWEQTAMSVAAVTRQLWLDDVTNSIGVTFLGQQLRCAKCHDHKFDPIPTRDYYGFQANFASTKHHLKAGRFKVQTQPLQAISVLKGGALENPGERVETAALSLLADTAGHELKISRNTGRRAALANWISSENNPLTARVIVNRVWQMHFGRGLVATPNDFGKMGARPTHPELLDWLARWFIDHDWSIKELHRLILSSETYRQSSRHPEPKLVAERDPENRLWSRFPARRLSAEEIRDSMLAISGELNRKVGGPSIYPEINWEVAFQPRLLMGKIAPPYEPSPKRSDRNRRSIYAVRIRNLGHPFMEVMNRPGSELSCDRRDETTVAPQAFTLLHGEFVHERALALADHICRRADDDDDARVSLAFEATYGRKPSTREVSAGTDHLHQMLALHRDHKIEEQSLPKSIELQEVAERTGKASMKTFPLKNLANYEEDLKPWQVNAEVRALADLCLVLLNSSEFLYVY